MERVRQFIVGIILFGAILLRAGPSLAGTVMYNPGQMKAIDEGESYPESRFGSQPKPINVDSESRFQAWPTEISPTNISIEESGPRQQGRSLASADSQKGYGLTTAAENSDGAETQPIPKVAEISNELKSRKGIQEIGLIAGDLGFFPKTIFVNRDTPVRLFVTGASKTSLCIMMDSFQVKKQIKPNKIEEINFTPATAGKFKFYCPVNGMEGTMIVREIASNIE